MSKALSLAHVFRVFRDLDVYVLERDAHEAPITVCVKARSASECQATLPLLAGSPTSFVLFNGICYFPDGSKRPFDPTRPTNAAELCCQFDVEWIESGPPPRVTLFTYTEQEWENAKQAVCHLLQSGKLSPQSSIEASYEGHKQGFSAYKLDAVSHTAEPVTLFREAASYTPNDLHEADAYEISKKSIKEVKEEITIDKKQNTLRGSEDSQAIKPLSHRLNKL